MTFSVSSYHLRPLIGGALLLSGLLTLVAIGSQPVAGQKANTPAKASKGAPPAPQTAANSASAEFFEKSVRPILVANCYTCHAKSNDMAQGGMQLDSREGLLKGGKRGPALVPGDVEKSLILHAISYQDNGLKMPPKGKLTAEEIAALTKWVKDGAVWPVGAPPAAGGFAEQMQVRKRHWAWQPLQKAAVPVVKNKTWVRNPIDSFILAKLEEKHLRPAPEADRRTLIRRLNFDLVGLPPTPQEIDAFLADKSPDAYEKVVDRLLASPHYGERWARHWLDLARFAETDGHEFDFDKPNAWMYRDYVVRALNEDLPYNRFAMEQIAGDLLPRPRINPAGGINESLLGTTFWWLGEGKHSPVDLQTDEAERIDNQIDVFSKTFLGLSVGCARCHNHKFDAISTKDYYALSGYLKSSRYHIAAVEMPERFRAGVEELKTARAELQPMLVRAVASAQTQGLERFEAGLLALGAGPQVRQAALSDNRQPSPRVLPALNKYLKEVAAKDPSDPLYPWYRLGLEQASEKPETFRTRANAIAAGLKARGEEARKALAEAVVFEDFHTGDYRNWDLSGEAFGVAPERVSLQTALTEKSGRITGVMGPGVADSGAISAHLQGEMRSHTFTISKKRLLFHAAGEGVTVNLVIDGFHRIQYPIYGGLTVPIKSPKPTWYAMETDKWIGHHAYIEVLDRGEGSAALDRILFTDGPTPPDAPDPRIVQMLEDPAINSLEALTRAYRTLMAATLQTWQADPLASAVTPESGRAGLLGWMLRTDNLLLAEGTLAPTPEMATLLTKCKAMERSLPEIHRVMAITDGSSEDDHVHIRGNYKTPGDLVPRRFFEALNGPNQPVPAVGSGRLELAQRLTAGTDPLFPRVMVNRIWMHHFGDGIVKTPDDFGVMGERPTHPELLDWLAREFMRQGWSLKQMHRLMVTSATYRMASRADAKAEEADPQNRLLHRTNIRRLEAECIRDAALTVSGRLDPKLGGPSVMPYLTEFMAGRGRPGTSGPLDGDGRRSLYIGVRRNFLTPFFVAFDYPVPFTSIGRRSVSNVPAQALALMNNPLFQQQAEVWAKKTLALPNLNSAQRIDRLYQEAYGRPVTATESTDALAFLAEQDKAYGKHDDPRSWADLCHVLFNVKEFIFIE